MFGILKPEKLHVFKSRRQRNQLPRLAWTAITVSWIYGISQAPTVKDAESVHASFVP